MPQHLFHEMDQRCEDAATPPVPRGPKRKGDRARTEVNSQRYTAAEMQAIERAADGKAADFIRTAAVRAARRKQCPK